MRIKRRLRPGGYTFEACIPAPAIGDFPGEIGALWELKLTYQNVNEIYRTNWDGLARLR